MKNLFNKFYSRLAEEGFNPSKKYNCITFEREVGGDKYIFDVTLQGKIHVNRKDIQIINEEVFLDNFVLDKEEFISFAEQFVELEKFEFSPNTPIYRVIVPEEYQQYEYSLLLPGGNSSLTGFWTPYKECADNILNMRNEECGHLDSSYSYAKIISTTFDNVVVERNHHKSGNNSTTDRGEIFITKIINEKLIK